MTKFVKSNWLSDGNNIRLAMPLAKVDKENRLVSGYATLDNVDTQGDVVLSEASAKAFARARGNLREMHQPIAVGKVVDFREDEFYDTEDNKFYRGIYVTAYVSKGAQDTWEKVLDGTLTGFSIGGEIVEASNEFVKESNKSVRFIKDYNLVELSLVDNPANQLANVFSITKAANGSVTVNGIAVETEIENVFWCKDHPTAVKATSDDTAKCVECGTSMDNIGWFESGVDRAERVRSVVNKFLGLTADNAKGEGGVEMTDSKDETEVVDTEPTADDAVEEVAAVEEEPAAEPVEEVVEEDDSEPVEEVADYEEEAISKKIDELHDAVKETLEKSRSETTEQVQSLEKKIDEIHEAFVSKASELEARLGEFGEKLETSKSRLASFEKKLDAINSSEAFRKSADLEESPVTNVQKSETRWNGTFSLDTFVR